MRKGIFFCMAAFLFLMPSLLKAEGLEAESYFSYMPSRKTEATAGRIEVMKAGSEISYEFKAFEKLPIEISLENKHIGIENSSPLELPAHLTELVTDIETTLPAFALKNTYIRFGVSPSFYSDGWDFPASSFRIPSRVYVAYLPNSKLILVAGVAVVPEAESSVFPILGVIFKPNDRLSFNLIPDNPNISYVLNEKVTVFGAFGGSFGEYEVEKEDLKNAMLQYRELRAGGGVTYRLNKFIEGSLSVGGVFNRYLKYRDSLGKVNIKNGVYTQFGLKIEL